MVSRQSFFDSSKLLLSRCYLQHVLLVVSDLAAHKLVSVRTVLPVPLWMARVHAQLDGWALDAIYVSSVVLHSFTK